MYITRTPSTSVQLDYILIPTALTTYCVKAFDPLGIRQYSFEKVTKVGHRPFKGLSLLTYPKEVSLTTISPSLSDIKSLLLELAFFKSHIR
jgi:hypothetical protein